MPLQFPDAIPVLAGERLTLRAPTEDDIPAWFARATDTESAFLAGDAIPESMDMGAAWLDRVRERFRRHEAIRWTILEGGSEASAGSIGLTIASAEERIAELGFVVGRAYWGRGIASEAGRLVVRHAFTAMRLAELRAEVLEMNAASRRVLEKLGFHYAARIPEFDTSREEPLDGCLYVLRLQE